MSSFLSRFLQVKVFNQWFSITANLKLKLQINYDMQTMVTF